MSENTNNQRFIRSGNRHTIIGDEARIPTTNLENGCDQITILSSLDHSTSAYKYFVK